MALSSVSVVSNSVLLGMKKFQHPLVDERGAIHARRRYRDRTAAHWTRMDRGTRRAAV